MAKPHEYWRFCSFLRATLPTGWFGKLRSQRSSRASAEDPKQIIRPHLTCPVCTRLVAPFVLRFRLFSRALLSSASSAVSSFFTAEFAKKGRGGRRGDSD